VLYRVDYTLGVTLAGFLAGMFLGRRLKMTAPAIGDAYFRVVLVLLVPILILNMLTLTLGPQRSWTIAATVIGTGANFIFGAVFGTASGGPHGVTLLQQPRVLAAIRITTAFTFVLAAVGKAFSMPYMTGFFKQSGYPVTFLMFIIVAEAFAGVAILVDWFFLIALAGLMIDMFGAIVTHVHNGDPLDDSTGAINMLLRLFAMGCLWQLSNRSSDKVNWRLRFSILGCACSLCLVAAVVGSIFIRHLWAPK